jgi:hypothetical protein
MCFKCSVASAHQLMTHAMPPFLLLVGLRTCRFDPYISALLLLTCLDTRLITRDSDSLLDLRSCFYS